MQAVHQHKVLSEASTREAGCSLLEHTLRTYWQNPGAVDLSEQVAKMSQAAHSPQLSTADCTSCRLPPLHVR